MANPKALKQINSKQLQDIRWDFFMNSQIYDFPMPLLMDDMSIHKKLVSYIETINAANDDRKEADLLTMITSMCNCYQALISGPHKKNTLNHLLQYFEGITGTRGRSNLSLQEQAICGDLGKRFRIKKKTVPYLLISWLYRITSFYFDWVEDESKEFENFMNSMEIVIRYELYQHKIQIAVKILEKLFIHINWNGYRYRSDMAKRPKPLKQYQYLINLANTFIFQCTDITNNCVRKSFQVLYYVYPIFIEFTLDITKWYWHLKRENKEDTFALSITYYELKIQLQLLKSDFKLPPVPYQNLNALQQVYNHLQCYKAAMLKFPALKLQCKFKKILPSSQSTIDFVANQIINELIFLVPKEKECEQKNE